MQYNIGQLDKNDRRLLYLLDSNSRISYSELARELRLPEETVRYRVKRLMDEGIVSSMYPVIAAGRLGVSVHKVMLKLQKADEREIEAIGRYISRHALVNWVARFDGCFDIGCTLLVNHVGEVASFLEDLRRRFHLHVRSSAYAVNLHAEFFPRDYLVRGRRTTIRPAEYLSYPTSQHPAIVDALDWHILRSVAADVRVSAANIAKEAGVSAETISRRLQRLERDRVISGYRLVVDHDRLGLVSYYMLLYLNSASEGRLQKLTEHLRAHPCVVYLIKMLGAWDYDVCVELPNVAAYRSFVVELMKDFADVIRDVETLVTWKILKYSLLPSGQQDTK